MISLDHRMVLSKTSQRSYKIQLFLPFCKQTFQQNVISQMASS